MPPAERVRGALERVLSSGIFARSERARHLLRYLVEQDLAGNAERLKGFSIAVDVFGKNDDFDPATDTVVRVQAGRLRDLLDQYYAGEGASARLRITIPRGTYVPEYRETDEARDTVSPAPAAAAPALPLPAADPPAAPSAGRGLAAGRPGLVTAGLCLAALLFAAVAYRAYAPAAVGDDAVEATGVAGSVSSVGLDDLTGSVPHGLLPSVFLEVGEGDHGGERIASALRRGLAGFDTVYFIARPPDASPGARSRTDFVFAVEDGGLPGEAHLELQHIATGKVLLSRNLATDNRSQAGIDDEVADILTSVAPVSGVIYASLSEFGAQTSLIRCLALNDRFYRDQNPAAHREAYRCLEDLAAAGMESVLIYSELAALHVQSIVSRYGYPENPSQQQALDFARTAVQLAPNSPYAHRSMGYVLSRTATQEEALRWTRRAYELNTFDLGMAASYGYALIFNGEYGEGTPILQRAVTAASAHPTWWDYGLFLGHFMLDDMQAAANAVSALASSTRVHYVAVRLIAADGIGARDEAEALLAELAGGHSRFAAAPEAFFRRGNYPQDMTVRLVEALRDAGLEGGS